MTILNEINRQIRVLQQAQESIAAKTAHLNTTLAESLYDIAIVNQNKYETMIADSIAKATLPDRNIIHRANQSIAQLHEQAIKLYKNDEMALSDLTPILDSVIEFSKVNAVKFDPLIKQAKETVLSHSLDRMWEYSLNVRSMVRDPLLSESILKSDQQMLDCYNQTLDYLIESGNAKAIHEFFTSRKAPFYWFQSPERLIRLLKVIHPSTAAVLFESASELKHLMSPKILQLKLLENADFHQYILSMNFQKIQKAFERANWTLADFESDHARTYQITWLMLTQKKVVRELLAQGKMEKYLDSLDLTQLQILFSKALALVNENDLELAARQQLARRLLQLDKKIAAVHAFNLVQLGIYQLNEDYDLARDIDGVYNNQLITDTLVANWSGWVPWVTYVNNIYVNKDAVSPKAFEFILSNIDVLTHVDLTLKDIKMCIKKAGDYLSPTTYLACINVLRTKNFPEKVKKLINLLPYFLQHSKKLSPEELTAVQALAAEFYRLHPKAKDSVNDPILRALRDNSNFAVKYAILGPMIFSDGRTVVLHNFLEEAKGYKIPALISQQLITGFANGMLMGIAGYGVLVTLEKVAGVANSMVNPFAALQAVPSFVGTTFTTVAAGVAAVLTGGGVATTVAIFIAPILASALIGGIVGALVNTGGRGIVNGVKRAGNWVSNQVFHTDDNDNRIQQTLFHGLNSADPQVLRKRLYDDNNTVLRENLAKMILQQEAKGFDLEKLPVEIQEIVKPIRDQYYNANKSVLLKASDYILGNLMAAVAWTLNLFTFNIFDLYYPGPVSQHFSYQNQKKLAAEMPTPVTEEPVTPSKTQAQIMKNILPKDPATAYLHLVESKQDTQPSAPPAYTPPSPSMAQDMQRLRPSA